VESNKFAAETIRRNRPRLPLIERKIEKVSTQEILRQAELRVGEAAVLTGGPSCQTFSTAGRRGSLSDPRGSMFKEFLRVVREARPRFFVMENVCGVLSAAVRHRPLAKRGPGFPQLGPDEELGSAFLVVLHALRRIGYYTVFKVVNAADFGVPQARMRVVFIGSRDGEDIRFPRPTHAVEADSKRREWVTLKEALAGLLDDEPAFSGLSPKKLKYLAMVPPGGNWRDLPSRFRRGALGGAYVSWGGRNGFYRRLAWDRVAPALTTRPDSKATMLIHPTEDRPLSVHEYARLQQFPDDWTFGGGVPQQYIQIGNAVPAGLAEALGRSLMRLLRRKKKASRGRLKRVVCPDPDLVARLVKRERTRLNPPRMRRFQGLEAARRWLKPRSTVCDALKRLLKVDDEQETSGKEPSAR
jgi:DNA (cytosine-5)-methyltransferase 1